MDEDLITFFNLYALDFIYQISYTISEKFLAQRLYNLSML